MSTFSKYTGNETSVLSSSDRSNTFTFYFYKYSFFIYSVSNDIFSVDNIINTLSNNLYITGLLTRDNKFLYFNCKVAWESISLFH